MELRNYLNILWRRRWIIILTIVVTVAVVGIGTHYITPVYQASTTLRIAVSIGGQLNYSDYMYADRLMNTYVEIATSRPLIEELIKRLGLTEPPILKAEIIPNTELIKITVEDVNPNRAALVANTLVEILIGQSNRLYTGGGKNLTEVLSEQLAQIKADLDASRQEYEKLLRSTSASPERIDAARQLFQLRENNYATLLGQYEQALFREEIQASMITLVETAITPQAPSKPRIFLNYALGFMIGLVGGLGLAFVFENLDTTLYTAEGIETATELTALAKIPKAQKKQINIGQDSFSPLAEAFRNLATNIQLIDHQPARKVLLIMSPEPNQGKSTVVYSLALSLAEIGKNVVAIDCDLRLPKLHTLFTLSNEYGLTDVLEQKISLKKALHASSYGGIKVLTSGALPLYPSKLLGSPQMVNLIDGLSQQFDYVLLDTPALSAAADITTLVPKVDCLVLVVRLGYTRREALQAAKRFLAGFQDKSIDLIINQTEDGSNYDYYQHHRKSNLQTTVGEHKILSTSNRSGD